MRDPALRGASIPPAKFQVVSPDPSWENYDQHTGPGVAPNSLIFACADLRP